MLSPRSHRASKLQTNWGPPSQSRLATNTPESETCRSLLCVCSCTQCCPWPGLGGRGGASGAAALVGVALCCPCAPASWSTFDGTLLRTSDRTTPPGLLDTGGCRRRGGTTVFRSCRTCHVDVNRASTLSQFERRVSGSCAKRTCADVLESEPLYMGMSL